VAIPAVPQPYDRRNPPVQLVVARIGRAHGIKGEVTVEVRTDEPELRLAPGAVLATDPPAAGPLTIETGRVHGGRLLLRFASVDDRDAAEALRNTLLIADVDPDESPDEPDEYYDHQLIDLDVVTADGTPVGRIAEISHLPAQDLFVVRRPGGGEVMIPFVEEIVTEIDLVAQRTVIDPPPGLIDDQAVVVGSKKPKAPDRPDRESASPEDTSPQDTAPFEEAASAGDSASPGKTGSPGATTPSAETVTPQETALPGKNASPGSPGGSPGAPGGDVEDGS
jgi:16S rRNA processing protein RimM